MGGILVLLYGALGYWAAEKTVYAGQELYGTWSEVRIRKTVTAFFLGWVLIPVAIMKRIK